MLLKISVVGMREKAKQEDAVIWYISNERFRSVSETNIVGHPESKGRDIRFNLDFKCIATYISSIRKENWDHIYALSPIPECIRGISFSMNCNAPGKLFRAVAFSWTTVLTQILHRNTAALCI